MLAVNQRNFWWSPWLRAGTLLFPRRQVPFQVASSRNSEFPIPLAHTLSLMQSKDSLQMRFSIAGARRLSPLSPEDTGLGCSVRRWAASKNLFSTTSWPWHIPSAQSALRRTASRPFERILIYHIYLTWKAEVSTCAVSPNNGWKP